MPNPPVLIPSILSLLLLSTPYFCLDHADAASADCPIDFAYVSALPWDASLCRPPVQSSCCQALRSVFGIGLSNYLNRTLMFYLPDAGASAACLADFHAKLVSMSIPDSSFPVCFNDTAEFANRPSSCAGITSLHDWSRQVPKSIPLESSCNGDLTGPTSCGLCLDAGISLNSYLVSLHPNSTKCFFFATFYAAAIVNEFGPEDVRSASCILGLPLLANLDHPGGSIKNKGKIVFGLLGGIAGLIFAIVSFIVYRRWDRKRRQDMIHRRYVDSVKLTVLPNTGAKWFCIEELERATDGFSQLNMIGQGGFGVVYKGMLLDGTQVAVKQLLDTNSTGDIEFTNEAEIISNIRHRNLLPLRGFCVTSEPFQGQKRYLVYDYMSNGSLDDHIFNNQMHQHLTWPQRKNIILDIAKGLSYLHYGIKPAIFHRDIKATNILLDSDMKARVADFGLAKQNAEGLSHLTTRVAGTHGYLAPEYALYGQLTEKSDVYSFGIVILEMMSGKRALDPSEPSKILITDRAWSLVKMGKVEEVYHESIRTIGPKGVMERFVHVGILCAHVMVALRPTIADALKMLEGDIDIPRLPDRPLPLSQDIFNISSTSFNDLNTYIV